MAQTNTYQGHRGGHRLDMAKGGTSDVSNAAIIRGNLMKKGEYKKLHEMSTCHEVDRVSRGPEIYKLTEVNNEV